MCWCVCVCVCVFVEHEQASVKFSRTSKKRDSEKVRHFFLCGKVLYLAVHDVLMCSHFGFNVVQDTFTGVVSGVQCVAMVTWGMMRLVELAAVPAE